MSRRWGVFTHGSETGSGDAAGCPKPPFESVTWCGPLEAAVLLVGEGQRQPERQPSSGMAVLPRYCVFPLLGTAAGTGTAPGAGPPRGAFVCAKRERARAEEA